MEKGFCWVYVCSAFYMFNGVGKSIISDESVRAAIARARAKVARVSESTPSRAGVPPAMPTVEVTRGSERTAEPGTPADIETLKDESLRR